MRTRDISNAVIVNDRSMGVLRDTYRLLAGTLVFSGVMAMVSMALALPSFGFIINIVVMLGLLWALHKNATSSAALPLVFAFTGFMGLTLGPMLSAYMAMANGPSLIATAMLGTGAVFGGLSMYAVKSGKDFTFMGGFLMAGMIAVIVAMLAVWAFDITGMSAVISSVVILLMSGFILYDTSRIINGGETNYILATVSMFLSIYNIFVHLLNLLNLSND
jgi:modulator of FtsH protease